MGRRRFSSITLILLWSPRTSIKKDSTPTRAMKVRFSSLSRIFFADFVCVCSIDSYACAFCPIHQKVTFWFFFLLLCVFFAGKCPNVLDIPLPMTLTPRLYMRLFESQIIPFIRRFKPDLIMFSAGFDARHGDAVAGMSDEVQFPLPLSHPGEEFDFARWFFLWRRCVDGGWWFCWCHNDEMRDPMIDDLQFECTVDFMKCLGLCFANSFTVFERCLSPITILIIIAICAASRPAADQRAVLAGRRAFHATRLQRRPAQRLPALRRNGCAAHVCRPHHGTLLLNLDVQFCLTFVFEKFACACFVLFEEMIGFIGFFSCRVY